MLRFLAPIRSETRRAALHSAEVRRDSESRQAKINKKVCVRERGERGERKGEEMEELKGERAKVLTRRGDRIRCEQAVDPCNAAWLTTDGGLLLNADLFTVTRRSATSLLL